MILFYFFITVLIASFLYSYFTKSKTDDGSIKTISRKSWQYKLIVWTIGREPVYNGYCPFFWSVWACIALIPATLVIKMFGAAFSVWGAGKEENKRFEPDIYLKIEIGRQIKENPSEPIYSWCDDINEWKARTPNWEEICVNAYEEDRRGIEKTRNKMLIKKENRDKRNKLIDSYTEKLRWLFKPFIFSIGATLVISTLYGIKNIVGTIIAGTSIMDVLIAATVVFSSAAIIFGVKFLLEKINKLGRVISTVESKIIKEEPGFVEGFFEKFWAVLSFPFKLIGKLYQKECPIAKMED